MEDYTQDTIQQREIHSVTEINQTASDFLNEAFPPLWVAGEISNFREYGTSGHWYFSIKELSLLQILNKLVLPHGQYQILHR